MGGGKDQKTANKQLTQQGQYQTGQQQAFDTRNTRDLDTSRAKGDDLYASLRGGYQALADRDWPGAGGGGGGGWGGGGGGHVGYSMIPDDPRLKDVEAKYREFMQTGGWDPAAKAGQEGRIKSLTQIGETGGISEEDKARIRGGGVYEEFSRSGGFNDKDIANIRSRGVSGIPAMYARLRDEANRGASIAGGAGPGRAILAGRMGREQSKAAADAALNAELGIKEQVNKGRQWGTQGMTSSETGLQDLLTRNKLQGLTGASDIQGRLMESIMGGQQWGTGGINQLAESTMGRQERAAASQAAAASANASEAAANERWAQEFGLRQKATGLEGLQSLYTSSPDEYMQNKEFALKSASGFGGTTGDLATRLKSGNKSAWDTGAQYAGAIAGGLTGAAGIAGMFRKPTATGGAV